MASTLVPHVYNPIADRREVADGMRRDGRGPDAISKYLARPLLGTDRCMSCGDQEPHRFSRERHIGYLIEEEP